MVEFSWKKSLSTTSRVLALAASAGLTVGRDASAVASWGDRFPMEPISAERRCAVKDQSISSQARRDATWICLR
jgi:hypothetical protein